MATRMRVVRAVAALLLAASLAAAAPASASQEIAPPAPNPSDESNIGTTKSTIVVAPPTPPPTPAPPETVYLGFDLELRTKVPAAHFLMVTWSYDEPPVPLGITAGTGSDVLCSNADEPSGPGCVRGGSYGNTFAVPKGVPVSYKFIEVDSEDVYGDRVFFTGQQTFSEDATVSAIYQEAHDETAYLSFELTVEGEPPEDTTLLGLVQERHGEPIRNRAAGVVEDVIRVPLWDSDGDHVYTGYTIVDWYPQEEELGPGAVLSPYTMRVDIVQETGGNTELIRHFDDVRIDGDKTFEASVSFSDDGGGSDNNGSGGASDNNGGSGGGIISGIVSGILPETGGGWAVLLLIVGVVLVGGGWLLVRRFSTS